ncbi:MAG: YgcG family protein [Candidatus Sericytochromatia bacterium]
MARMLTITRLCLLVLLVIAAPAWGLDPLPEPVGLVNDGAQVFQHPQDLETRLVQLEKKTGVEMAIVTLPRLPQNERLEAYSTRLFNQWGIGKKHEQNGLLFLLAFKERKMRLEVGSGLKVQLPDAQAQQILDQTVKPKFKSKDFDGGLQAALSQIEKRLTPKSLEKLEAEVGTYATKDDRAWIWGLALLAAFAIFGLITLYWLLRFVLGFFRSFGRAIQDTSGPKSKHKAQHSRRAHSVEADPLFGLTQTSDPDTWRSSFRSDNDTSSSYDSFGGGSSDGGGASSDW